MKIENCPPHLRAAIEKQMAKDSKKATPPTATGKRTKFNNVRIVVDRDIVAAHDGLVDVGEAFDSKLEFRICIALRRRYGKQLVARQVSFSLPGGIRMKPDFVILHPQKAWELIDAKGADPTPDWKNKAKLLQATHGLSVRIVRKESEI